MIRFVIPAYNEELNIGGLLTDIIALTEKLDREYMIVVVNDGSGDGTVIEVEKFVDQHPVVLLNHEVNRGVNGAFRTGFDWLRENASDDDLIVTIEGDGSSPLSILPEMLDKADSGADLVLASCYRRGGKVIGDKLSRLILSIGANMMIKIFFPIRDVWTYTSFYRIFRFSLLNKGIDHYGEKFYQGEGFTIMTDILIKLSRLMPKPQIAEVPMILRCDKTLSTSKMNISRTITGYFVLIKNNFCR